MSIYGAQAHRQLVVSGPGNISTEQEPIPMSPFRWHGRQGPLSGERGGGVRQESHPAARHVVSG